ncbi:hypothetical protein LTS18_001658, partial [Coniosporium uncinatum]
MDNNNDNDNDKKTPTKRYSLRDHTHTKTNMRKSLNPEADEFIPGGEFSSAASSPEMISSPEKKKGKKRNGKKAGRKEMWVKKKDEGVKGVKGTESPVSKKKNGGEKMGLKGEGEGEGDDESGVQADFGGGEDVDDPFTDDDEHDVGGAFSLTPQHPPRSDFDLNRDT